MSKINIYTYEIYLLDFFEGRLNEKLEAELRLFIRKHPEVAIDLDTNPIDIFLPIESELFVRKGAILKDERAEAFTDLVIAEMEQTISEEEEAKKSDLIELYPYLEQEEKLIKQIVLTPNLDEQFSRKAQLIQKTGINIRPLFYWSGRAASIIVLLAVYFFNQKRELVVTDNAVNIAINKPLEKNTEIFHEENIPINNRKINSLVKEDNVSIATLKSDTKEYLKPSDEIQTLESLPVNELAVKKVKLITPEENKIIIPGKNNATMAMTDESLDLLSTENIMEKLFGITQTDSTINEKKGFTIRIGKLVLLHFGRKNKTE
ncbi:MAG: hypothetical protein ABI207_02895 [Crocinitomicaceae bacterium]